MQRHLFIRAALGVATLAMAASSFAQAYPAKPIRMVIPFPPGGTLDTVGRMLAQKLGDQMGQNFIVENKAGGNGVIGGDVVAKAPADGYTLLFNASTFTTAPMTMSMANQKLSKPYQYQGSSDQFRNTIKSGSSALP